MIDIITSLYIFLAVVVALFTLIPSKLEIGRRLVLMSALCGIALLSYRSINSRAGLPTVMPNFQKHQVLMLGHFPDKEQGLLYVWMRVNEGETPKTYVLGLNRKNLAKLEGLRSKHKGKPYYTAVTTKKNGRRGLHKYDDQSNIDIEIDTSVQLPPK